MHSFQPFLLLFGSLAVAGYVAFFALELRRWHFYESGIIRSFKKAARDDYRPRFTRGQLLSRLGRAHEEFVDMSLVRLTARRMLRECDGVYELISQDPPPEEAKPQQLSEVAQAA